MLDGLKISSTEFVLIGVGKYHDKLMKYEIVEKSWTQMNLIIGRHGHSSAFKNGKIIISGGRRVISTIEEELRASGTEIIDTSTWTSRIVGGLYETMIHGWPFGPLLTRTETRITHGTALMSIGNEVRLMVFGGAKKSTDAHTSGGVHIPNEYIRDVDGEPIFMDSCKMWDDENEEWVATDIKLKKARKEIRSLSIPWLEKKANN